MKGALICWFALGLPLFAGTLTFDSLKKDLTATGDEKTLVVDFPFKNDSSSDAVIADYKAGCTCSSVEITDSKLIYKPGESGSIRLTFDMSLVTGTSEKTVAVYLKGDPETKPTFRLVTSITVPALIEVEPKSLIWDVGSEAKPLTATLTMNHSQPIKVISVSSADGRFKHELKTIEEGKKYEIVVTPSSTDKIGMGVIHVETDCDIQRHRSQRVFSVIRQPLARPAQPATTP